MPVRSNYGCYQTLGLISPSIHVGLHCNSELCVCVLDFALLGSFPPRPLQATKYTGVCVRDLNPPRPLQATKYTGVCVRDLKPFVKGTSFTVEWKLGMGLAATLPGVCGGARFLHWDDGATPHVQWDGLYGSLEGHVSSSSRHLGAVPEIEPPGFWEIGPH